MFSANSGTGSNAYRTVGVESMASTATPHQLVLMLFNGARAAVAEAKGHLDRHETAAKGLAISKAISIIDGGLKASLDLSVGGELAKNLSNLYVYMGQRLFYANLKNDSAALDEVAKLLQQLGDAWGSIATKTASAPAPKSMPVASPVQANPAAAAAAQESRPATSNLAQTYGTSASGRVQTASVATANPSPSTPAGNTEASSPSAQSRRLAAAYGVR
jgi:flagellar protein FliS